MGVAGEETSRNETLAEWFGLRWLAGGKLPRMVKIRNPWGNSVEWTVRF